MNAPHWGKPESVHGMECLWSQLDAPPMNVEDLLHSAFTTSTPLDLVFNEDARGKRLYFAVRWEGNRKKRIMERGIHGDCAVTAGEYSRKGEIQTAWAKFVFGLSTVYGDEHKSKVRRT